MDVPKLYWGFLLYHFAFVFSLLREVSIRIGKYHGRYIGLYYTCFMTVNM